MEAHREQLELERNHYWADRDRLLNLNAVLREQMQALTAQIAAAQAAVAIRAQGQLAYPCEQLELERNLFTTWKPCNGNPCRETNTQNTPTEDGRATRYMKIAQDRRGFHFHR